MIRSILRGEALGLICLVLFGAVAGGLAAGQWYRLLNARSIERVKSRPTEFGAANHFQSLTGRRVTLNREIEGSPYLRERFDPAEDVAPLNAGVPVERKLLARYRLTLPQPAKTGKPYASEYLLVEATLEKNARGEWRLLVDVGVQMKQNEWTPLAWWNAVGATSNELISVTRNRTIHGLLNISTPTTIQALTNWLEQDGLAVLKEINPDYATDPQFAMKAKEFEAQVVGNLKRVLPQDWGGIANLTEIFLLNTFCAPLQFIMICLFLPAMAVLGLRWFTLVRGTRRAVRAGSRPAWMGKGTSRASAKKAFREVKDGYTVVENCGAIIVFLGLLGTLLYLALGIACLCIDRNAAIMSTAISLLGSTFAQAFLTTVLSASFQIVLSVVESQIRSAEGRAFKEVLRGIPARKPAAPASRPGFLPKILSRRVPVLPTAAGA